jgi:hypothetical protein
MELARAQETEVACSAAGEGAAARRNALRAQRESSGGLCVRMLTRRARRVAAVEGWF